MSSQWWANQIGTASAVTTPAGSFPQLDLAVDLGTAPWTPTQFSNWAQDEVQTRTRAPEIQQARQKSAEADESWALKALGAIGGFFKNAYGEVSRSAHEIVGDDVSDVSNDELASQGLDAPGIEPALNALHFGGRVISTPLIVDRNTQMKNGSLGMWFDSSAWAKAWREADIRDPGSAVIDAIITDEDTSQADLDRIRRTNSLYTLSSLGVGLVFGMKFDPTVIAGKGLGEGLAIKAGRLPRGQSSVAARGEAVRVLQGQQPYRGINPLRVYGAARGKVLVNRWPDVRTAAKTLDLADYVNLPMFRGKAVGGVNAAMATRLAAADDNLWDLTRRAVAGDPEAWTEITRLHETVPEELAQYAKADTRTYLDALDAARTEHTRLEAEVEDLEKQILRRDEAAPRPEENRPGEANAGFYRYHTWELDRDLELKKADLADLDHHLQAHQDYGTWLRNLDPNSPETPSLEQISAKQINTGLRQHTYHASPFSKAHSVSSIAKGAWTHEVNPYDLKRASTGAEAIGRTFRQLALLGYYDRDGLNGALDRFLRAPNELERYKIAKEVEDTHVVRGLAQHHGLSEDTVRAFLDKTRARKNHMLDVILSGDGAVYSTAPGLDEGAKLLSRDGTNATIEVVDGDRRVTMSVPEEALSRQLTTEELDGNLPVDPTQLPSWYVPMNIRQMNLAIKRDPELFRELDTAAKNFGRREAGNAMELMDLVGSKWNHIWKPLQLFRLAWPQRVLMDEAFRSMAMLGVEAWAKEFAPAAMKASYNAVRATSLGTVHLIDKAANNPFAKRKVKIGPGPVADEILGKKFDLAHDLETEEAPFVPAYFSPTPNQKRMDALDAMIGVNTVIRRQRLKQAALVRETRNNLEGVPNATDGRIYQMMVDRSGLIQRILPYEHRINRELEFLSPEGDSGRLTYDPLNGKQVKTGYAVPVVSRKLRRNPGELKGLRGHELLNHDLNDFIEANRDLLGSGGYRLMFDKEKGEVTARVVRIFASTQEHRAIEFGKHVNADFYQDLKNPNVRYFRDWNDQSPIFEALDRMFTQRPEPPTLRPGESPAEGVPPVYHGAASNLPDELLPREQAPQLRGNLYGQGFYTTVDRDLAEQYSSTGVYTIRGAKDGKTYKVFDLDRDVTPEQAGDLEDYLNRWLEEQGLPNEDDQMLLADEVRGLIADAHRGMKWRSLFESLDSTDYRVLPRVDVALTRYLEERQGAGALTHQGGVFLGGKKHQVYIWLHPEELHVRPAYEASGKFHLLEEWFENPESMERLVNQVPESRIQRTGLKPRAAARAEEERANALGADFRRTERREMDEQFEDIAFNHRMDSTHDRFVRRLLKRKQHGAGFVTIRDADGKRHRVQQMLQDEGEVYVPLISSSPAYSRLTDGYQRTLNRLRSKAVGHKRILPPADLGARTPEVSEYYQAWADLMNDQVRNSPIWFKMLNGESDEKIISWLENTAEGSKLRHKLPHKGHNPTRWVEEHRQALDFYLPDKNLQDALRDRQIRPSELRHVPQEKLPEVFGPDLEMIEGGTGWGRRMAALNERLYKALGSVPTDILVRQPFANGMYKLKMRNQMAALSEEQITPEHMARMQRIAREFALRQVKRTLYDLTDDTNFTQALRFLAPFWGAQQEAMEKWARIVAEKPETVARFYVGQDMVYSQFQTIDEDGKPVHSPDGLFHYNPNHRIVLQIPPALKKLPVFQKALANLGSVDMNIGMMNTALQGDQPLLPGLGPIAVLPADFFLDNFRKDMGGTLEKNDIYNWLFPVGRPDGSLLEGLVDQMFPSWVRRLEQMSEGQKNRTYANSWVMMQRELEIDHRKRGLPPPTPREIKSATDNLFLMRSVASFGLPVTMNFRPKHQFFLDEYHKMQQLYGPGEAVEKFVQKYGVNMAHYAASSSESDIPPTAQGLREWAKSDALMAKYPDWASAMISPEAWADEFSSAAYNAEFEIPTGPGSSEALRTMRKDRIADIDRTTGWIEYRKFNSALMAELYNRGLNTLTSAGAEDLAQMKSDFVADLMGRNQTWAEDYRTFEDTADIRVHQLAEWAYDKRFDNRPDIQGVRQYLALRDAAAESLDEYHATTGGSRSLQAQENSNLRNWFYGQVGQLIMDNPAFGEFYTRYLESDRLTRGSGI